MGSAANTGFSDYDRLKEINLELSTLGHKKKSCQLKTSLFGALGGVVLAASSIALFHNFVNSEDDWANNRNSPVHQQVMEDASSFKVPVYVSLFGYAIGLGLFFMAKSSCTNRDQIGDMVWALKGEMRSLRDQMYPHDVEKDNKRFAPPKEKGSDHLLDADEVRGEYIGIYNPPGSHKATGTDS
ncbi:MAG: hypothetical protein ABW116_00805 [Candidatus Sedimenticola sp. 20ELBAFRAG]